MEHGATRDLARHLNEMRPHVNFSNKPVRAPRDASLSVAPESEYGDYSDFGPMLHNRGLSRQHAIEDVPDEYFDKGYLATALTHRSRSRSISRDRASTPFKSPAPSLLGDIPELEEPDINDLHEQDQAAAQRWEANRR